MTTASVYWGLYDILNNGRSRDVRGAYLVVDENSNDLIDVGTYSQTQNKVGEYQECIRRSLDRIVPTGDISGIEQINIQDRAGVKPELEIGRLPYAKRDNCRDIPIELEQSSLDSLLRGLANHSEDMQGCPTRSAQEPLIGYVDASHMPKTDKATIGIALYGAQSKKLKFLEAAEVDTDSSRSAEFLAVKEACIRVGQLGRRVKLYSDYDPIKSGLHDEIPMRRDISTTKSLYKKHVIGDLEIIDRNINHLAHGLSRQAHNQELIFTAPYIDTDFDDSPVLRETTPTEETETKYGHLSS